MIQIRKPEYRNRPVNADLIAGEYCRHKQSVAHEEYLSGRSVCDDYSIKRSKEYRLRRDDRIQTECLPYLQCDRRERIGIADYAVFAPVNQQREGCNSVVENDERRIGIHATPLAGERRVCRKR